MKEEGGAGGYTFKNWIALGENILNEASNETLTRILSHEIFPHCLRARMMKSLKL